jgi:hypothetical protein
MHQEMQQCAEERSTSRSVRIQRGEILQWTLVYCHTRRIYVPTNGVKAWAFSSSQYVRAAVQNVPGLYCQGRNQEMEASE